MASGAALASVAWINDSVVAGRYDEDMALALRYKAAKVY